MTHLPSNIDVSKLTVSKPNVLSNGAKLIYVNYDGIKSKFKIQTPKMYVPFGLNEYTEGPYPKYSLNMSYRETDLERVIDDTERKREEKNNTKIRALHDKMLEIEDRILDLATENATTWFKMPKKQATREIMSTKVSPPIVQVSVDKNGEPNGKYAPTSKLKIYNKDGSWGIKVFEDKKTKTQGNSEGTYKEIEIDSVDDMRNVLCQHSRFKGVLTCVGIWVGANSFMCQWALSEVRVPKPVAVVKKESDMIPDSDDEYDEVVEENSSTSGNMVPDSDEDEDEGEGDGNDSEPEAEVKSEPEVEPEPEPAKPVTVKKKKLKKKVASN
tara:strand:+ start:4109 stop:5089 length:981 start_codon:yes stop_codon:yes gene_type:complete